jgi:uncharacterized oxidoreductase
MKLNGNTILITGGGSGIGQALAHRFHDQGNTVIVAGRRREALERASEGRPHMVAMPIDVDSTQGVADFARRVIAEHPNLNVLINNAGIMRYEEIGARRDLADAEATIATNLLGPIRLIDALVDHLIATPDAAIVNVTSGLAFVPLVSTATYSATKAAMHSYTVSLREALKGKVEVIELAPPAVQTDLTPGQRDAVGYMPLDAFADEAMALLARQPAPKEVLVEAVKFLRDAEAEGRFDAAVTQIGEFVRQSRTVAA